jgi:hypothetical protein
MQVYTSLQTNTISTAIFFNYSVNVLKVINLGLHTEVFLYWWVEIHLLGVKGR